MTQSPQEIINERHKKVLSELCAIEKSTGIPERCFGTLKAANSLVDYLTQSNAFGSQHKRPQDDVNILSCLDSCASFLNLTVLTTSQQLPLLISFLPLHKACLNAIVSNPSFCSSEFDSAWRGFLRQFTQVSRAMVPFQFRQLIVEFVSSLEVIKTNVPSAKDKVQMFQITLNQFQQMPEGDQKAGLFRSVLDEFRKFRVNLFELIKEEKGAEWKHFVPPQFFSALKVLEDSLKVAHKFMKLKEIVSVISNNPRFSPPSSSNNSQVQRQLIQTSLKVMIVMVRFLSTCEPSPECDQWLFDIFEVLSDLLNCVSLQNDRPVKETWEKFLSFMTYCKYSLPSAEEQALLSNIHKISEAFCINYPQMTTDVENMIKYYNIACSSSRNHYVAHDLYQLLSLASVRSTNRDFTLAVAEFKRVFSQRLVFIHLFSLSDVTAPLLRNLNNNSQNTTTLQLVSTLSEAAQKLSVIGVLPVQINDFFISRYKFFLNFLKFLCTLTPDGPRLAEDMLVYHPSFQALSSFIKLSEDFNIAIEDIIIRQNNSAIFMQSVRMKGCKFGSVQWLEKAGTFFQYSLGRNKEVLQIISNFSILLNFYKLIRTVNERYPSLERVFPIRTSDKDLVPLIAVCEQMMKILPYSVFSNDKQIKIMKSLHPLVLHSMYTGFLKPDMLQSAINNLSNYLYIPQCPETLIQCYSIIDSLTKIRMKYPQKMGKAIDEKCKLFFNLIDGQFPDVDQIKQVINTLIDAASKVSDSLKSEISNSYRKLQKYISICYAFNQIIENYCYISESKPIEMLDVMRVCTEINQLLAVRMEITSAKQSGLIIPEKMEAAESLLAKINEVVENNTIFTVYTEYSSTKVLKSIMGKYKSLGSFIRLDYLYHFFQKELPSLKRLIKNSTQLSDINLGKTLAQISELLSNFALVGNKFTLFSVEEIINGIDDLIVRSCPTGNGDNVLEVGIFRRQFKLIHNRISTIRFILDLQEYPPAPGIMDYSRTINDLNSLFNASLLSVETPSALEALKQLSPMMEQFTDPSFIHLLDLQKSITPIDVANARIADAKNVQKSIKDELERMKQLSITYPKTKQQKIEDAQRAVDAFNQKIEEAEEKQKAGADIIDKLTKEKTALIREKERLVSMQKGAGQLHFDNEMSSVISLLLRDEESLSDLGPNQPLTEADFIAEQLQEALRTNLRLKKSILVMSFPHEKAVFTPTEFATIIDKFTSPIIRSTPFATQHGNEATVLRQTLKEQYQERDNLFKSIVSATSKSKAPRQYKSEILFSQMQLHAKGVTEGASRRSQKEQFLEFTEVSDQFFLDISSENKELEEEIARLQSGVETEKMDPDEQRRILLKKLESQCKLISTE